MSIPRFESLLHLRHRRRSRALAGALAVCLVVTLSEVPLSSRPADAAEIQKSNEVLERPDKMAALITARLTGKRVKVTGMTSETEEFIALPDGQIEATMHVGPVRLRRANGWVPIDLTLEHKGDGSIAPKAHPNDLKIKGKSEAGDHDLASMMMDGQRVAMGWKGKLPEPVLDGNKATYQNTLPGVDMVVGATRFGVEQFFVVKNPGAAMRLSKLIVPLRSAGLKTTATTGGVELRNMAGKLVGMIPAPEMWDARVDPTYGWHTRRKSTPLSHSARSASASELVLSPDVAWITDPATSWPVTISPMLSSVVATFDTYVREDYATDRSTASDLQIGKFGASGIARSFVHWNTSAFAGGVVTSATVNFFSFWSNSCTARSWQIWSTGPASAATRFAVPNQPAWNTNEATSTATKGFGASCDDGWVSANATDFFNRAAQNGQPTAFMGIRAGSETDADYSKQFRSMQAANTAEVPYATVTYNAGAATSNLATIPATTCTTGSGRPLIGTLTPTLKATVSDPEAASVKAEFEWYVTGGSRIGGAITASAASGTTFQTSVPSGALGNNTYSWRVRGSDGTGNGTWSSWCEITVDTTAPAAPSISSTSHPTQSGWYSATSFTGTVSALDPNGIAGYGVVVDGTANTSAQLAPLQTTTSISVSGQPEGVRYVHVSAKDNGGNWSATTHYKFNVDTTKPGAPAGLASSTHPISTVYYPSQNVVVNWTAPSDLSGIGTYAIKIDQNTATIPATADNLQSGSDTDYATTVANGTWWIHVRAKDNAGNWSGTASHIKVNVDTSAPVDPTISSDTHPDQNAAYHVGTAHLTWVASTATGFSITVDQQPNSTPDTTVDQTNADLTMTPGEGTWYLHVRAKGSSSNWTVATHYRLNIDITAPIEPGISSTDFAADTWSDKLNQAGAFAFSPAGSGDVTLFRYQLDDATTVDVAVTAGQNGTAEIIPDVDGPHTLTVWSLDKAGNISPAATYRFFIGVSAGSVTGPVSGEVIAAKTVLSAIGHSSTSTVSYEWRRSDTDTWTSIPAGDVTVAAGNGAVTWPLVSTVGAYPALNWDVARTINDAEVGTDPLDGPLQVRATFGGNGFGPTSTQKFTFNKNLALGASTDVGPGSVNLTTGNYTLSGADVSAGGLAVGRTYNTRQASKLDAMFGPGWGSSVVVGEGASPYTRLDVFGSLIHVGLPDGTVLGFTATGDGTTFEPPAGSENITVTYATATDKYVVVDVADNNVVFGRRATDPVGQYHPETVTAAGSTASSSVSWETTTVDGVEMVRPTKVIAAAPSGVTCNTTLVRGCQAIAFSYATTTTGTASVWGDYVGRVKAISWTAWNPITSAMSTIVLARYGYDDAGRLRSQWNPRLDWQDEVVHHFQTCYTYNSDGILIVVAPPGQEPWEFTYTTLPGDAGKGRIQQVTRSALAAGSNTTSIVYRVPVTGAGAPYDLSSGQTSRWSQAQAPTDATAVFPATQLPDGNQAAGTMPTSFERATVSYLDANARPVNIAQPGGHIDATMYDQYGHVVRELTASQRAVVLAGSSSDTQEQEAALAAALSTSNVYGSDGKRLTDTFGPEHDVVLDSGEIVRGRIHSWYAYDEGAPETGGPFGLVTTESTAVQWLDGGTLNDDYARVTATEYDWNTKLPVKSIEQPRGASLTTRTAYDSHERVISQTSPAGGDSDTTPSTRITVYYSAGSNNSFPQCGNHPEWDGLTCLTKTGGQPTSGPELPATSTTYNMDGQPLTITETTSVGTLRTSFLSYDAAGRLYESVGVAPGLGEQIAKRRQIYDASSGQNTRTQTVDGNGNITAEILRGFDTLGRQVSYVDSDGNVSTVTYELLGRLETTDDGKAIRRYTYDEGNERRGLATSVTDSNVGRFTGSYDPDGNLTSQTWPNGVTVSLTVDVTGQAASVAYVQSGCGQSNCTLYSESVINSAHGQVASRTSTLSSQYFFYDEAGRVAVVEDISNGECSIRSTNFDAATNRSERFVFAPGVGGVCQTETATETTWTYDTADRVTNSGYSYDALGRTLTMPGSDTADTGGGQLNVSYHTNDMARTIAQGTKTNTYTLDVNPSRFRSWTDGALTRINHYATDGDSPTWTDEGNGEFTRMIAGLAGIAAQHTTTSGEVWMLSNLHGDFIAVMPETGPGLAATTEYTETGQPKNSAHIGKRYGWLGQTQRAADTPGGITLMGARLYTPGSGRFLSTDPIYGGGDNAYEYCGGDAINCEDPSGLSSSVFCRKRSTSTAWYTPFVTVKLRCYLSHWLTKQLIDGFGPLAKTLFSIAAFSAISALAFGVGALAGAVFFALGTAADALGSFYSWAYNWCRQQHGVWLQITLLYQKPKPYSLRNIGFTGRGCRE